ncbi:MAG: hypothetical protein ACK4UN_14230 [Limisphaerales bacterium]
MSLMRLLTLNRSVNPTVHEPHRYKMSAPLPKFAPTKRPVSLAPKKAELQKETVMQTESLFDAAKTKAAEAAQNPLDADTPRVLSVGVFPKTTSEPVPSIEPRQSWFARLKSFFKRKPRQVEAVAPVQTEWSLDRVTVVRNDLSDSDFEVVVAQGGAVKEKAKGKSLVGRAWKKTEVSVANPEPVDTLK